jgi:cytochrome c biogenesis protein
MSQKMQLPELGVVGLARYLWRQLTSMRTALILLLLMGIAAIPGSLIPQRLTNPIAVREFYISDADTARLYDRFYLFDVFGSPWFSAIYILLFISLIGCVLPRTVEHFKAMRAQPPATPKNLERMEHHQNFAKNSDALTLAEAWFEKNRFRIRNEGTSISAEKGFIRESGNLLFHLSLILILIGVGFGSLFGMRGEAIINVGERFFNVATSYDTLAFGRLSNEKKLQGFEIKLDRFEAEYNTITGAPKEYSAFVTVVEDGISTKRVIQVNEPLTFGNTRVYLQANGYSPVVTVRDAAGNVALQGPVPFLPQDGFLRSIGAIKVPDAEPQLGFVASFLPTQDRVAGEAATSIFPELLDPKMLFAIWKGDLGLDSGVPQSIYRIDTEKLERIGLGSIVPGETYSYPEGSITLETVVPWVNLQMVEDPGKQYALIGGIFAIAGLLTSLYGKRRRIWVRVVGEKVEIAGLSKNDAPGLDIEIAEIVKTIKGEK